MKALSREELQELRSDLALLCIPDDEADELIRIIDNIVISIIEQNLGLHPVQFSLSARANRAFAGAADHANLLTYERDERIDLRGEGASNDTGPEAMLAP